MSAFEERLALHREAYRERRRTHESGYMSEVLRSILATKSLRASYELGRLHRARYGLQEFADRIVCASYPLTTLELGFTHSPMTFQSKYLTVREAAAMLGISVQRVHQLMAEGKLPCVWKPYGWRKQTRHILTTAVQKRKQLGAQQEAK